MRATWTSSINTRTSESPVWGSSAASRQSGRRPYATALAAMIDPVAAAKNSGALPVNGGLGPYGTTKPDFTSSGCERAERRRRQSLHGASSGMSIVAIDDVLNDAIMQTRFHDSARVRAADLLLQERTPRHISVARPRGEETETRLHVRDLVPPVLRRFSSPHDPIPKHICVERRYTVMLTSAGSGFSRWSGQAVRAGART